MREDRARLDALTRRWRARHEARRAAAGARPPADPGRQAWAAAVFPYRTESPAAYADAHGESMIGFTFDAERYDNPALDAWLLELGELLRARRPAADQPRDD